MLRYYASFYRQECFMSCYQSENICNSAVGTLFGAFFASQFVSDHQH